MKTVILGAGAIGGYYGTLLHRAGHDVAYVARGETLDLLRERGLQLTDATGEAPVTETIPVRAAASFADAAALLGGPDLDIDVAVIATKALPGNDTFGDLSVGALADVPVVTTHNSVEVHHLAAEHFGADRVLAGVVRTYAERRGPADIVVHPGPTGFNFGLMPGASGPRRDRTAAVAEEFAAALRGAGFYSKVHPDIMVDVWSKAMYVTTTGVLGALSRQTLAYLRGPLRPQLAGLMEEVAAAGRAHGVNLPADVVEQTLGFADKMPGGSTSSMHRDIIAGLPNELDAQSGAIRRMAARAGVSTPLFDMAHGCLEGVLERNPDA